MAVHATVMHNIGNGIADDPVPLLLFKSKKRLIGSLAKMLKGVTLKLIFRPPIFSPRERIIAV